MKIKFPHWQWLFGPTMALYFGFALNMLVITANRGVMPVWVSPQFGTLVPGSLMDDIHSVWSAAVHLKFLADWIMIPHVGIASPGDFFIWTGEMLQWPAFAAYVALVWKDNHST